MSNISMYEMKKEYSNLLSALTSDELTEDEKKAYLDTLDDAKYNIEEKVQNITWVINELESRTNRIDDLIDKWQAEKGKVEKNIKNLKDNIKSAMELMGTKKIKTDYNTISIINNGGLTPMVVNSNKVPDEFMKVIYVPDTEKIRNELNKGKQLDFAYLDERRTHLVIK